MFSNEKTFKKTAKDGLKSLEQNREWLTEQRGVKKKAVDEWFKKNRDISTSYAIIKQLIDDKSTVIDFDNPSSLPDTEQKNKLFVTLDPEKQHVLEMQAFLDGITLSARFSLILEWAADHEGLLHNDILAMFDQKWQSCEKNDAGNAKNSIG